MTSKVYAKIAAGICTAAAVFSLSACGNNSTTDSSPNTNNTTNSSTSSDNTGSGSASQNSDGKSIDLRQNGSVASITYQVNPNDDAVYPTGKVTFTVGNWTTTTDQMSGTVYPVLKEGSYNATMTYTTTSGTSMSKSIHFTVVPQRVSISGVKVTGPLSAWTSTWKLVGNPIIEGKVTMVNTTNNKVMGTATVQNNMVSFPIPAVKSATNTNVQLTYTRLDGSGKTSGYFTVVSDSNYTS